MSSVANPEDLGRLVLRSEVSRRDIVVEGGAAGDRFLDRARPVVTTGTSSMAVLVQSNIVQRIDVWASPAGLVLHGYHDDPDFVLQASWHDRSIAAFAVGQLLRLPREASPLLYGPPERPPVPAAQIGDLIEQVANESFGEGSDLAVVSRAEESGRRGVIRLHTAGRTRWATLDARDVGTFSTAGSPAWFASLLEIVGAS